MKNWKSVGGSVAFITLMGSTAAFADVTAQEVWTDWHDYMTDFGYQLSSTDTVDSGMITVKDLTMSMKLPDDDGTVKVVMGTITFKENGDGTVAILMDDNMPIAVSVNNDFAATLNYGQTGMTFNVSGTADKMAYDYKASQLAITLADLTVEGEKVPDAVLDLILKNVASNSVMAIGNLRSLVQTISADSVDYKFSLAEPGGNFRLNIKGAMADLVANTDMSLPKDLDFNKMAAALTAGFAAKGGFNWGAGGYEFDFAEGSDAMKGNSSSTSGSFSFGMDRQHIQYGGTAKGVKASISGSDIPLPSIDYEIADAVFDMVMPIDKSETPSDYSMTIKLADLSVSDGIWGMLDPSGALPHSPATVNLVLDGKANWLVDIMDPESEETKTADIPGQLHALTLKELQVKIAGADLTGSGAFTFNNDDLETFDGLPAPTGDINLKLVGGNGLLDNLIKMGMVPQDEAMGVRMMMGLFAVAGDGEDTLTSKIEVKDDGSIFANGQRLK